MSNYQTIQAINYYVENYLLRFGFTAVGNVTVSTSFRLSNYNKDFSNAFKVDSEYQAKEILKSFVVLPFTDDIFKTSTFDSSKDLYLFVDIQLPTV